MFSSTFLIITLFLITSSFSNFSNVIATECPKKHYTGKQEKFVVILKDISSKLHSRSFNSKENHFNRMSKCLNKTMIPFPDSTKNFSLYSHHNEKDVLKSFNADNFITGYVGYFDPNFVKNELKNWNDVNIVEKEKNFTIKSATTVVQTTTLWVSHSCDLPSKIS
ncbi:hypothetical protein C1645_842816 [Glomus cerebriforme]|uniref:Inhibitor I9 domain-containing protein n=1 Tax=Glomus cerebriforme TaxID=658196 RepID=A0A397RWU0_9GLOM|nr:hypothetical protein C1645_842816 [Glomus cerebriforme]